MQIFTHLMKINQSTFWCCISEVTISSIIMCIVMEKHHTFSNFSSLSSFKSFNKYSLWSFFLCFSNLEEIDKFIYYIPS